MEKDMTLPINAESYDYKYNKTLNEDVNLVSNTYGKFDLDMDNGDYVNVTGVHSLENACIIAIMTRYNELKIPTYTGFGCKVHDLIKGNKHRLLKFKIETSITEVLENMRRIKKINWLKITEDDTRSYKVVFNVTSINDEIVQSEMVL